MGQLPLQCKLCLRGDDAIANELIDEFSIKGKFPDPILNQGYSTCSDAKRASGAFWQPLP
ncbi:hypothetical protein [Moorena producens]|uniref:hypothetical protein n=1 Tax=Moorena producens TaxID=1155739 RepID=UPI003C73138C